MRVELANAGFRQFEPTMIDRFYKEGWQKCIRDTHGKVYFITLYVYDHPMFDEEEWIAQGQFNTEDGLTFNIELFPGFTIEQVETFFRQIYSGMGCKPYDG